MSIFGLTPYRGNDMANYFNDLEKSFFGMPETTRRGFRTDIMDKGDHYVLEAELPGFKKEDIDVHIEGDYLTIEARHEEKHEDKKGDYVRRERSYGSFCRSFDMTGIDASAIGGKYENGILELTLPKQKQAPVQQKKIELT